MTSTQIDIFLEVARCLNYTTASSRLYVSQSTVSRQISLLEEELGFDLFMRGNNYIRLTPEGTIMVQAFQTMKEFFETQKKIAQKSRLGESGSLKIGFLCNMDVLSLCQDTIEDFTSNYPGIVTDYLGFPNGGILSAFSENAIDIIFTHEFSVPENPNYLSIPVYKTNSQLIYGKCHPLALKSDLSFSDFSNELFWVVKETDTELRRKFVQNILDHYQIDISRTSTAPNFDSALLNIQLGNGVAFTDPIAMPSCSDSLCIFPLDPSIAAIDICAVWKKDNLNPSVPLFVNLLLEKHEKR